MGRWEELHPQIWETVVTPCGACGQVVAKRLWVAQVEGEEHRFCSERCEGLFRDYVLPRRRAAATQK